MIMTLVSVYRFFFQLQEKNRPHWRRFCQLRCTQTVTRWPHYTLAPYYFTL